MDPRQLINGLILYLGLLVLLTFHEFGHAWMAWKCGDDTALSQGRVSLNPLVHIDLIGTVAVPLLLIFFAPGGFFVGWAKPVPVNSDNFKNPRSDDIMVTLAGPWMNFLLAIVIIGLARLGFMVHLGNVLLQPAADSTPGRLAGGAQPDRDESGDLQPDSTLRHLHPDRGAANPGGAADPGYLDHNFFSGHRGLVWDTPILRL